MTPESDGGFTVSRTPSTGTLMILAGAAALAYVVKDHLATPYDAAFDAAAKKWNVPGNLLRALARVESNMRTDARNPKTGTYANGSWDTGLMQINTKTGAAFGYSPAQLLEPLISIDCAAHVLADNRRTLGARFSPYTWPASYNVGPDLTPWDIGAAYASKVLYHQQLYDFGRMFA